MAAFQMFGAPASRELYLPAVATAHIGSDMSRAPWHDSSVYTYDIAHARAAPVDAVGGPKRVDFSPYEINGGTAMAIAGKDYCIIASDTRMSTGYSIHSRNSSKYLKISDKCILVTGGMQADRATFYKHLRAQAVMYEHKMGRKMSCEAFSQLTSTMLYYKRFFPYYCFSIIGGLDVDGVGCVYSYDAVGSFQRQWCAVQGSGASLIQPLLDGQVDFKNQMRRPEGDLSAEEMVDLIKDAFSSAGERDIYTGDFVDIHVVKADGVAYERFNLKLD
eukprot:c53560_g1_i1.p2 GENE.c53560_g1_i1~~c53560_g1_i1.p2  ORF type:complete len:284 (-),score=67.93 c53560_g1_i1:85-909(-)